MATQSPDFPDQVSDKRLNELERRKRIFDAKTRIMGVDKNALDIQCLNKQMQREWERQEKQSEGSNAEAVNVRLQLIETAKSQKQRESEKACRDWSLENLHFGARREFALNDPHALKKDLPARLGDDDPRCGPSSMQKFGGEEDVRTLERKKQEKVEMRNTLLQQKAEKKAREQAYKDDHMSYQKSVMEANKLRQFIEANEAAEQRQEQMEIKNENLAMADEHAQRKKNQIDRNSALNVSELQHHLSDGMLTETANHYNDFGRIRRDAFKGATEQEIEDVANERIQQGAARRAQTEQAKQAALEEARLEEQTRQVLVAMEQDAQRQKRDRAKKLAAENQKLALEQKAAKLVANEMNKNKIQDTFYTQFGNSIR